MGEETPVPLAFAASAAARAGVGLVAALDDAIFGLRVSVNASPFAPVRGNDHSIQPDASSPQLQAYYTAWAPLFTALRGGCWWLAPEPVRAEAAGASPQALQSNGFTVGGGCTAPLVNAGNGPVAAVLAFVFSPAFESAAGDAARVSLAADPVAAAVLNACAYTLPGGGGAWVPLPAPARNASSGRWDVGEAPLARGAVLFRCTVAY